MRVFTRPGRCSSSPPFPPCHHPQVFAFCRVVLFLPLLHHRRPTRGRHRPLLPPHRNHRRFPPENQ